MHARREAASSVCESGAIRGSFLGLNISIEIAKNRENIATFPTAHDFSRIARAPSRIAKKSEISIENAYINIRKNPEIASIKTSFNLKKIIGFGYANYYATKN